jgi:type I restriction enzyme R subunit
MNEAETRAELIDKQLEANGWGTVAGSRILREFHITSGKIQSSGNRGKKEIADYILIFNNIKLAVVEAKSLNKDVSEGIAQAKRYADKLQLQTSYSANGKEIYQVCHKSGVEGEVTSFLSPDELWQKTFAESNIWRDAFASIPFEDKSGSWQLRYYQELAVQRAVEAISQDKNRILLTLATGTGKTAISFQIAWKLFQTRWNLHKDGKRRPRILFLADRNILADQAYNSFSAFPDDALIRIKPSEIRKGKKVPTNGSIFFTIFQTFMSGSDSEGNPQPSFGEYPRDYFDLIIIDECHRGGANDEGNWRGILEYFALAVQLGLTATPKREDNIDTYKYFGDPVFVYSLKEGINDGFLTPFKVKRIQTTLDDYRYTPDDELLEGEIEAGKLYQEKDFNRTIEILEREAKRVQIFLNDANQREKTIVFCANQEHAARIRDLFNQLSTVKDPFYCVRVTANDGEEGERYLREFQDNEKSIPTILTTSQKLSTGVDARNVRNIVLFRPVNSMIEFKQIVGRGTRLFDGKDFFSIYDFVDAYKHFSDPEWDGEPIAEEPTKQREYKEPNAKDHALFEPSQSLPKQKAKVKLGRSKAREIQFMMSTSFWNAEGRPITSEQFLTNLFGTLPSLFTSEEELRKQWSKPDTRKILLDKLDAAGFPREDLKTLQRLVDMEKSDLYDVLEYVFNGDYKPLTREERVKYATPTILAILTDQQREFIKFVLDKYVESGFDELAKEKLPKLLELKYNSLPEALDKLGNSANIAQVFIEFQACLYAKSVA